jgi:membrane fusion protein, heavy metal efflux system
MNYFSFNKTMYNHFKILLLVFPLLAACSHKKNATPVASDFCIPDSLVNKVQIDTAALRPVTHDYNLVGKISFDQDHVVKIFPLVSGVVTDVKVSLGDYVKKGQILAIIKSTEMAGVQNDLVIASSNLAVAEKNYAATADMYKSGIISEKEYTSAKKELEKAQSEVNRASSVHSIYGNGSQSNYIVHAPISGYIVEKQISANMQMRPDNSSNMFTISDLQNVWVLANVYESDVAHIHQNEKVNVTTISYPDKRFAGTINKIYNVLDPDTKTMKIQINISNKEGLLKPEMFANVNVEQKTDSTMLCVPSNAVIFDRNQNWVVVYKDKCHVEARKIDIVSKNLGSAYIRSGLKPGEKVISSLQLLIYEAINQQ